MHKEQVKDKHHHRFCYHHFLSPGRVLKSSKEGRLVALFFQSKRSRVVLGPISRFMVSPPRVVGHVGNSVIYRAR